MNRRGFLRGLLAGTAVAALPVPVAKPEWQPVMDATARHGTITGRWSAKRIMFARAYGAGDRVLVEHGANQQLIVEADFMEMERRVMAWHNTNLGGGTQHLGRVAT